VDDVLSEIGILPVPAPGNATLSETRILHIAHTLLGSIKARQTPSDIIGFLVSSPATKDVMDEALVKLIQIVLPHGADLDNSKLRDVMGIILEVRR
jgi:hypothetical protein